MKKLITLTIICSSVFIFANDDKMFSGKEDHSITLDEGIEMTTKFRENSNQERVGGFFGSEAILRLLSQEGAVGIRYYYARDKDNNPVLVLVGVDETGRDMTEGYLAEKGYPCPPFCLESALNTNAIEVAEK